MQATGITELLRAAQRQRWGVCTLYTRTHPLARHWAGAIVRGSGVAGRRAKGTGQKALRWLEKKYRRKGSRRGGVIGLGAVGLESSGQSMWVMNWKDRDTVSAKQRKGNGGGVSASSMDEFECQDFNVNNRAPLVAFGRKKNRKLPSSKP